MAFRRQSANPNPYPFASQGPAPPQQQQQQQQSQSPIDNNDVPQSATANARKRARDPSDVGEGAPPPNDPFQHENGSDASEGSDDGGGGKPDKKAGRRKIKIEFISDKSRRHITFSKRKAGIMKKAYELSTLTGTQVLLLVVSETGLVYTFTTAKLQPLVTQPEGKNLIQACLNAPHGSMPSSLPVGSPIGRSAPGGMGGGPGPSPGRSNVPGGLAIGSGEKDADPDAAGDDDAVAGREDPHDPPSRSTHQRRPSNASDVPDKSPTQSTRKPPSPPRGPGGSLLPQPPAPHYASPYAGLQNVGVDPSIYGHHYMPGQGGAGPVPGGSYGMGPGGPPPSGQNQHWQSTQAYRR